MESQKVRTYRSCGFAMLGLGVPCRLCSLASSFGHGDLLRGWGHGQCHLDGLLVPGDDLTGEAAVEIE